MNKNYNSLSRRKTPWDDLKDISPLQFYIRDEYREHYYLHHDKDYGEARLLNQFKPHSCPYCESTKFKKYGFNKQEIQKYKCSVCNRTFIITTGTIFQDHKLSIREWIEYLLNLFDYSSINLDSKTNKNALSTSKYWLAKVFLLLKDYQKNIVLKEEVQIDETYYSLINKEIVKKNNKKLRGLSKNKYCIGIACDIENVYCVVEGIGKTSSKKTTDAFLKHIKPGSYLTHDDEKAHNALIETLNLKSISYNSKYLKQLSDKDNPLRKINHYCFLLKKFLNTHSSFKRDELNDYLNLFAFIMNRPSDRLEKVDLLLEKSLNCHKIVTFRDYYIKK